MRAATVGLSALLACSSLVACGSSSSRADRPGVSGRAPERAITVDGVVDEWPLDSVMTADEHYLYMRFLLEGDPVALQANDETVTIRLDLDGSAGTGRVFDDPAEGAAMGIDLAIHMSPQDEDGSVTRGSSAVAYLGEMDEDGEDPGTPIDLSAVDYHTAPSFASSWFEARLARDLAGLGLPVARDGDRAAGMVVVRGPSGAAEGWSAPFSAELPALAERPALADVRIPPKPSRAIRVVCWNVLFASPSERPRPFARVLRELDPDIILLQEWTEDPIHIRGWFNALMPRPTSWNVRTGEGWGVAVVSHHPVDDFAATELLIPGEDRPVNFVGGLVRTPRGDVAAASVHLKCCGGLDTEEDFRRAAEAQAINTELLQAFADANADLRVVAGDMNLVGSPGPLDTLRAGLGRDGSDLSVARALHLGDRAAYTWRKVGEVFVPSRLDYTLVDTDEAEIVNAFVLDTSRLTPNALRANKLQAGDTGVSDHLPLVVDIRPR